MPDLSCLSSSQALAGDGELCHHPNNMAELTIGYVAGLISLGVFIGGFLTFALSNTRYISTTDRKSLFTVQVLYPTFLNFILAGILRDKETAATW